MKDQDYELLSQYIDAELPAAAAQQLRQRLMAEPELRAAYNSMRNANNTVHDTFNASGNDAVPSRVSSLLQGKGASNTQKRAAWGMAIAASLVAATGLLLTPDWRQSNVGSEDHLLTAALDSTPSQGDGWNLLSDGRQIRPVLSFAHVDGSWCREYLVQEEGASQRGIACRNQGQWVTAVLASQPMPGSNGEYRPAGAADADMINTFISSNATGIALSREEESTLISSRWQQ